MRTHSLEMDPIHSWFGLSYSSYIVLPRSILQSMPLPWQARFVECLEEAREAMAPFGVEDNYTILLRGEKGRIKKDPFADYQHGRRNVFRERTPPGSPPGETTPTPHAGDGR